MNTRLVIALILSVLMVLPATAASAQTDFLQDVEQAFIDATNNSRVAEGHDPLVNNDVLRDVARGWTVELVASQQLAHNPSYSQQYDGEWRRMGENVGYTSSATDVMDAVARLHQAFMDSPGHYANIMGQYNQIAVGAAMDENGGLWVTLNFLDGPIPADADEEPVEEPAEDEPAVDEPVEDESADEPVEDEPVEDESDFETDEPLEQAAERTHFTRG